MVNNMNMKIIFPGITNPLELPQPSFDSSLDEHMKEILELSRRDDLPVLQAEAAEILAHLISGIGAASNVPQQIIPTTAKPRSSKRVDNRYYQAPPFLMAALFPPNDEASPSSGSISKLWEVLCRDDSPKVQAEAAHMLACLYAGESANKEKLVNNYGALPNALKLLRSPDGSVREQAAWLLANITGDSLASRDVVLGYGVLEPLLSLFNEHTNVNILRPATLALFNLISYKPQPSFEQMRPAIEALLEIVQSSEDDDILSNTCWALEHLCDDTTDKFQALVEADVGSKLAKLFLFRSPPVQLSALRTVRRIVTRSSDHAQFIIGLHMFPSFLRLLTENHGKKAKIEVCRIISRIPSGIVEQIQALIDTGLAVALIDLFLNGDLKHKVEVARALSNATRGANKQQIMFLVQHKYIRVFCRLLDSADPNIIHMCIDCFQNVLNVAHTDEERFFYAEMMRDVGDRLRGLSNNHIFEEMTTTSRKLVDILKVWNN